MSRADMQICRVADMQSNSSQIVTCSRQQSMEEGNFAMAVL
jgi:hypothetical protein